MTCIIACYQIVIGALAAPVSVVLSVAAHHVSSLPLVLCSLAAADIASGALPLFSSLACWATSSLISQSTAIPLAVCCCGSHRCNPFAAQYCDCQARKTRLSAATQNIFTETPY
jgi:hypothetical protein